MSTNSLFAASKYDLTLQLQALFHETVALQTKLDNTESENTKLKDEHLELKLKLKEAHNEISRLVMHMKYLLSDIEVAKEPVRQTISAAKRSTRLQQTG